jgi:CubicO group peptidase (beta-lactamase class C family)
MKKLTTVFTIILIGYQCLGQPPQKNDYKEMLTIIDLWLDAQKDFDRLPGISVAIVHDQEIIFKKGYGYADIEKKLPMTPETIFSICSISKLFTSIAIMQLWERGVLRLDDSLPALLPDFRLKQQYPESVPITVHSMLTHSSGIYRDADSSWNDPNFYFQTTEEFKKSIAEKQTLSPASAYFQYSNVAMSLLGEIVSEKTGKNYNDYVEDSILKPLQLHNTHPYLPEKLWRSEMATGYSAIPRQGDRKMQPFFKTNANTPAAGYASNVTDLAKFASWQFRLSSGGKSEVLKSSTLKEMQRIQWTSPDKKLTWGLGFYIAYDANGVATTGHDGSCPGYVSVVMTDQKKRLGVTVMINAQGVDVYKYSNQIFGLLNKTIIEDTTTKNLDLSVYKGRYDNYAWAGETVVVPVKGKLVVFGVPSNTPSGSISEYQYVSKDVFRRIRPDDKTLAEELRFERDENGNIKSFISFSRRQQKMK